ncbi:hypothetical protein PALU110988_00370 [Paenibacillus lupini]|uniref:hypothetical protein n=1 Tax=Paenibacillus lupini TaxID=1450204 RepID=UPI00142416E4|nr:hypothetical protein [Paenibacillus lupini]NIK23623.1 hypothetical protein [Paenibacillus lupini]
MIKKRYYVAFLILLCLGFSMKYMNKYHIDNDYATIQSSLKDELNRGSVDKLNPKLIETVRLGESSSYIALFQLENNEIGYSQMIKGLNGKFKFERAGHGTNIVSYEDIHTNKGNYGILVGHNPGQKINHISAKLINEEFEFNADVSSDRIFVKDEKLPSNLKEIFPAELTFYDENNRVIHAADLM